MGKYLGHSRPVYLNLCDLDINPHRWQVRRHGQWEFTGFLVIPWWALPTADPCRNLCVADIVSTHHYWRCSPFQSTKGIAHHEVWQTMIHRHQPWINYQPSSLGGHCLSMLDLCTAEEHPRWLPVAPEKPSNRWHTASHLVEGAAKATILLGSSWLIMVIEERATLIK